MMPSPADPAALLERADELNYVFTTNERPLDLNELSYLTFDLAAALRSVIEEREKARAVLVEAGTQPTECLWMDLQSLTYAYRRDRDRLKAITLSTTPPATEGETT